MKKNILKIWPKEKGFDELVIPPVPAKKMMPEWYRKASKYVDGSKSIHISQNGASNVGMKSCMAFFDTFMTGYIVRLPCDVMVTRTENSVELTWAAKFPPLSGRSEEMAAQLPIVPGFGPFTQAWEFQHWFSVPKGYSILVTQPLNRFDLPTMITSGVVDADGWMGPGGVPFAIRNDFEGIIEMGTPIAQLIPFKRESWKHELIEPPTNAFSAIVPRNKIVGWYKEFIWKKKDFS